jgi:hypothetical protein
MTEAQECFIEDFKGEDEMELEQQSLFCIYSYLEVSILKLARS